MKICSRCGSTYSDRIDFCFADGEVLKAADSAGMFGSAVDAIDAPMPRALAAQSAMDALDAPDVGQLQAQLTPPPAPRVQRAPVDTWPDPEPDAPSVAEQLDEPAPTPEPPAAVEEEAPSPVRTAEAAASSWPEEEPVQPAVSRAPTLVPDTEPEEEPELDSQEETESSDFDAATVPLPISSAGFEDPTMPPMDKAEAEALFTEPTPPRPPEPEPEEEGNKGSAMVWVGVLGGVLVLGLLGVVGLAGMGMLAGSGEPPDAGEQLAKTEVPTATPTVEAPAEPAVADAEPEVAEPEPAAEEPEGEPEAEPAPSASASAAMTSRPTGSRGTRTPTRTAPRATVAEPAEPATHDPSSGEAFDPWSDVEQVATTGSVTFDSIPSGAKVTISGVYQGKTPLTTELEYGAYDVVFTLDGHADLKQSLQVSVPRLSVPVELEAVVRKSKVIVMAQGRDGDQLFIDGKEVGQLPAQTTLQEGRHTFVLEGPSGRFQTTREISFDGTSKLQRIELL